MIIEKVSCFPNEGTPQVIAGTPSAGDLVRITLTKDADGIDSVQYCRYSPPPAPTTNPKILSKTEYQDHCFSQLGGGSTGMVRYGAIMKAARSSNNDGVVACMERYEAANSVEKANAQIFIAFLVSAAIATQQEADAVINNWPMV